MKRLAAFQFLCDCLAPGNDPGERNHELRRRLQDGEIQWEFLAEIANRHNLCPALYAALNQRHLLECIPADLRQYLQALYDGNGVRNRRLVDLASETVFCLNQAGIEPVLLKGAANLVSGLYPDPNMRFLCDVDLLVPADKAIDCVARLRAEGFDPLSETESPFFKNHFHYPPLLKRDEYIRVELHTELVPEKYRKALDAGEVIKDSTLFPIRDARARIPSARHRLIHNVIHAQLTDKGFAWGDVEIRQLYDFVLLAREMGNEADWSGIAQRFKPLDYDALCGYLLACERFFGWSLPQELPATSTAQVFLLWICLQINHVWLMRAGNLRRLALLYRGRLHNCTRSRRVPRLLDSERRRNHYQDIASMLSKNW
jgi:hypothetical protein